MKFEIYCDECRPDLLSSKNPLSRYMLIGGLWLRAEDRSGFKQEIHTLRNKYRVGGEFKWNKISPSRMDFYKELVDWYIQKNDVLRFRCIAVDRQKVDLLRYHDNDQELGFYKFYYQLIHHWILDFNEYAIFLDFKSNQRQDRLPVLKQCLTNSNLASQISNVQAIRSSESVLIQLTDVLIGAAAGRLNEKISPGGAKEEIVNELESKLGRQIQHTLKCENKYNVFVIDLQGGW